MTLAVLLIFAAVFLTVLALYFAVTAARESPESKLKRRLQRLAVGDKTYPPEALTGELLRKTTPTEQFVFNLPLMGMVKKQVELSGLHISPFRYILLTTIVSFACFVVLIAIKGNVPIALLAAVVTGLLPTAYLKYCRQQRQNKFDEQLPDALTMIARSLRAGHSLTGAVELISQELPDPAGGLFKIAYEQQKLGMTMTDSLRTLLGKVESLDLNFFITIIGINSETGGNLSEILEKLADTIRARLQIRRQVDVYTAEGRMSGYVLSLMPVVLFVAFQVMNPAYMKVFFTERNCQIVLAVAVLAQIAGFFIVRKIVNIRI